MKKIANTEIKIDKEKQETTEGQKIKETETVSSTSDIPLPENVTPEPRNDEELHLDIFKDNPEGILTYLPVSDDNGEVLGDTELEQQVKAFCHKYSSPDTEKSKNISQVIEEAKNLATKYTVQTNMADNRLGGTITKYRIRQGKLFNIIKRLVQSKGLMWTYWFKENFDKRDFRTVEDYMRLAKIPGVISYGFLGKERLIQIAKYLKEFGTEAKDPIGDFFKKYIVYHPREEVDVEELKIKTDIAINHQRCIEAGLDEITLDMIDSLVRNGQEVEPKLIKELQFRKDAKHDISTDFLKIVASDKKLKPFETPQRQAESFKSTANRFISVVQDAIKKPEFRSQLDVALIVKIKRMVLELEQQVQATMSQATDSSSFSNNLSIN